jgi:hypothetical protein
MKECRICKKELNDDNFHSREDGVKRTECKSCAAFRCKTNYNNNKELRRTQQKQYYRKNREQLLNKKRIYKKQNKDKINQYEKKHNKKRFKNDSLFLIRKRIGSLICMSLKEKGFKKKSKTEKLIGISLQEFFQFLGEKPSLNAHLDHICPCAQAQNEEELIKLQHYTNLRWLSAEENLYKSNNWTPEGEEMCRILLNRDWIHES